MKLRNRNTIRNCKKMILYAFLTILFLMLWWYFFMFAFVFKPLWLYVFLSIITFLLHVWFFFLLMLKNNDYKLKYYFIPKSENNKIDEYCLKIGYGKNDAKNCRERMKDFYRQTGTIYFPYSLKNLLIEKTKKFNYKNSTSEEKLAYLTYNLTLCFGGILNWKEYVQKMLEIGFNKKEIISIFDLDYMPNEFKTFITNLVNEKIKTYREFYIFQFEITYLFEYLAKVITKEELKENLNKDCVYSPLRHIRFYVEKKDNYFVITKEVLSLDKWIKSDLGASIYATKEIANENIKPLYKDANFSDEWNFVWDRYISHDLPIEYLDLMDYYSSVQGEGHYMYLGNNFEEIDRITKSLKKLLPSHLFENFLMAKNGYLNEISNEEINVSTNKYVYEHLGEIEEIITGLIDIY